MRRSLRFLLVPLALAAAAAFGGAARADLPPSPLVILNAPAGGVVVPAAPAATLTFSFTVNWVEINKKYAKWGGAPNLFMAIGMHTGDPGAGIFLGDFLSPNQSSKSWKISEILAAMDKAKIPHDKRIYWDVIIRPHNTADPATTDRTETSFGFGPPPTPTPLVVSAKPGVLVAKPTATPASARAGGGAAGLQLAPTPTPTTPSRP